MCTDCGVTEEQAIAATYALSRHRAARRYRALGVPRSHHELEELTDRGVAIRVELTGRYRDAHPSQPMTVDEFRAWSRHWLAGMQAKREEAMAAGC